MTDKTVHNLTWDSNASKQNVEQAAQKIAGAVQKSTDTLTSAVKTGTEKIVEATKRTTTNAAPGNQSPTVALAVSAGLAGIAQSTAQTADYLRFHPGEMKRVAETMTNIGGQLTDLTDCAKQAAENGERLWGVVGETKRTAEYLGNNFSGGGAGQSVPVNNSGIVNFL